MDILKEISYKRDNSVFFEYLTFYRMKCMKPACPNLLNSQSKCSTRMSASFCAEISIIGRYAVQLISNIRPVERGCDGCNSHTSLPLPQSHATEVRFLRGILCYSFCSLVR